MVRERLGEAADDLGLRTEAMAHILGDDELYRELWRRVGRSEGRS
jgi:hypothetical protein